MAKYFLLRVKDVERNCSINFYLSPKLSLISAERKKKREEIFERLSILCRIEATIKKLLVLDDDFSS